MRILITEDDAALAEALQFSLSQAGHAVDWVANGAAADEALKSDVFGLLILDLGLPKLDGFEVLKRLRRRNAVLPVLILSGRESAEEKVMGLDLGADDYLAKPFSLNELQARVRALLRRGQGSTAPPRTSSSTSSRWWVSTELPMTSLETRSALIRGMPAPNRAPNVRENTAQSRYRIRVPTMGRDSRKLSFW